MAQNRIPPRNASNLAFVGKLLLLSLDKLKTEFDFSFDYEQWKKMYLDSKPLSNPLPSLTVSSNPQSLPQSLARMEKPPSARAQILQEASVT